MAKDDKKPDEEMKEVDKKPKTNKKKKSKNADGEESDTEIKPLDESDIKLLMRYGKGPYDKKIKDLEE